MCEAIWIRRKLLNVMNRDEGPSNLSRNSTLSRYQLGTEEAIVRRCVDHDTRNCKIVSNLLVVYKEILPYNMGEFSFN